MERHHFDQCLMILSSQVYSDLRFLPFATRAVITFLVSCATGLSNIEQRDVGRVYENHQSPRRSHLINRSRCLFRVGLPLLSPSTDTFPGGSNLVVNVVPTGIIRPGSLRRTTV